MKRLLLFCFFILGLLPSSFSQILINEICPANGDINYDPDFFNFGGWVELYNSGSSQVNVSGYYLSDDLSQKGKWKIPYPATIAAKGFLLLWVDGMASGRHASFKLDADGGSVVLSTVNLTEVDMVTYPEQYTNVSYGRKTDGDPNWSYSVAPTPAIKNGGPYGVTRLSDPLISPPPGRYSGAQTISLSHPNPSAEIRYTTNGSEPMASSSKYTAPFTISSTATLKARAFLDGFVPSKTEVSTYFINEHAFTLPVVSLSLKDDYLNHNQIGIYVDGTNGVSGNCTDRLVNWNQDWDRHSYFEYFRPNGDRVLTQNIDIRIGGACSRGNPQKSFVLRPRDKYGKNTLEYDFFESKPISEFGGLMLRNAGNDFWGTTFRDALCQSLPIGQMDIDYMAYQPAIVYLNGKYWGIQNIREKIDGDYIESNYGIDKSDVDLIETFGNAIEGSSDKYVSYLGTLSQMDLSTQEGFTYIDDNIDVQEYINYLVTEIYVGNTDWPGNNVKFWRQRSTNGKFRWILWDLDFGFALYPDWAGTATHPTLTFATATDHVGWPNPPESTLHIRLVLSNPTFRDKFIKTLTAAMTTTFKTERVVEMINSFESRIKTEVPYHNTRWQQSYDNWVYQVNRLREFASQRNEYLKGHVSDFFGLGGTVGLSMESFPAGSGGVELNGVTNMDPVSGGSYYRGLEFTLRPAPAPGYQFSYFKIKNREVTNIELINKKDIWKYFDGGTLPSVTWTSVDFDDATWSEGAAQLGYGNDGETTVVSYGVDPSRKHITTYFRKAFDQADVDALNELSGSILFDDGVVIYLNGEEVYRNNMPDGAVANNTPAFQAVSIENTFTPFVIPQGKLLPGKNVIAVEIHQSGEGSSDIGFDLQLRTSKSGAETEYTTTDIEITDVANSDILIEAYYEPVEPLEGLIINEFSASNQTLEDPTGQKDDWIEIYNTSTEPIDLAGLFITDNLSKKTKHQIAKGKNNETIIGAGEYKILWADEEVLQGPLHLNFKLSADGEAIALYQQAGAVLSRLDDVTFTRQPSWTSFARIPNLTGAFTLTASMTPLAENILEVPVANELSVDSDLKVYPNPTAGLLKVESTFPVSSLKIYNMSGQLITNTTSLTDSTISFEDMPPGLYSLLFEVRGRIIVKRIIKK
jgi:hypothetical protein